MRSAPSIVNQAIAHEIGKVTAEHASHDLPIKGAGIKLASRYEERGPMLTRQSIVPWSREALLTFSGNEPLSHSLLA
jgi:hypothetical protein